MILLYPWLATVYVAAVIVAVLLHNHRPAQPYVGRHRPGPREEYAPADRLADVDALAREIASREMRDDAQPMVVPDIDSDIGDYEHGGGAGRYAHLRTEELDAKAERDQTLADMGLVLRSPWNTPELLDEWVAEHEAVAA